MTFKITGSQRVVLLSAFVAQKRVIELMGHVDFPTETRYDVNALLVKVPCQERRAVELTTNQQLTFAVCSTFSLRACHLSAPLHFFSSFSLKRSFMAARN